MNLKRKGMASVEALLLIAVSAMILMGLTQYWQTNLSPQVSKRTDQVLGQEEDLVRTDTGFSTIGRTKTFSLPNRKPVDLAITRKVEKPKTRFLDKLGEEAIQEAAKALAAETSGRIVGLAHRAADDNAISNKANSDLADAESRAHDAKKQLDDAKLRHQQNVANASNNEGHLESQKSAQQLNRAKGELELRQSQLNEAARNAELAAKKARNSNEALARAFRHSLRNNFRRVVSGAGKHISRISDGFRVLAGVAEYQEAKATGDKRGQASAIGGAAGDILGGWAAASAGAWLGVKYGSRLGPKGAAVGIVAGAAAGYLGSVLGDIRGRKLAETDTGVRLIKLVDP